jgi:phosphate:Na+ symporter
MDFFDFLKMLGGLALFLYGMHALGEGLEKLSGGKLEKILEKLTSNPIMAVFLGAGVTSAIQSSSATTVMVVGFVNSGIMKLRQAVYIIMGANIGTTITSWILSLSGIESGNFFIKLLKPTSFSPILAFLGVVFILFSKKEKKKDIGLIMIGFAILMFGMDAMSSAVSPLAEVPEFVNILTMFENPIFGMMAGIMLTAVIQSSSASVGILQALCATGAVSFGSAIPIIMGQNIGTCVTALLSCIGTSKNAKRAALVHFYFNLLGTTIFMIVFYSINAVLDFSFLSNTTNEMGIAIIHSSFNIGATLLLLPFAKVLEKLAYVTIKEEKEEIEDITVNEFRTLDMRFLDVPGIALEQCFNLTKKMAEMSKENVIKAINLIENYDHTQAEEVIETEKLIDQYEDNLGKYIVKISSKNLSDEESKKISLILRTIGDYERISDHAINLLESSKELDDKKISFSETAKKELALLKDAVVDILNITVEVFKENNYKYALKVEPLEELVDYINIEVKKRHISRIIDSKCTIELGFVFSDITTNLERVSDHCSNIALSVLQSKEKEFEIHGYLDSLKKDSVEFKNIYNEYLDKYNVKNILN